MGFIDDIPVYLFLEPGTENNLLRFAVVNKVDTAFLKNSIRQREHDKVKFLHNGKIYPIDIVLEKNNYVFHTTSDGKQLGAFNIRGLNFNATWDRRRPLGSHLYTKQQLWQIINFFDFLQYPKEKPTLTYEQMMKLEEEFITFQCNEILPELEYIYF